MTTAYQHRSHWISNKKKTCWGPLSLSMSIFFSVPLTHLPQSTSHLDGLPPTEQSDIWSNTSLSPFASNTFFFIWYDTSSNTGVNYKTSFPLWIGCMIALQTIRTTQRLCLMGWKVNTSPTLQRRKMEDHIKSFKSIWKEKQ